MGGSFLLAVTFSLLLWSRYTLLRGTGWVPVVCITMAPLCLLGQQRQKCLNDGSGDGHETDRTSENSPGQGPGWVITAKQNLGGPLTQSRDPPSPSKSDTGHHQPNFNYTGTKPCLKAG